MLSPNNNKRKNNMTQILRKVFSNILNNKSIEKFYYGFVIDHQRGVMTLSEIDAYNNRKTKV
jgi:hypothetical protein